MNKFLRWMFEIFGGGGPAETPPAPADPEAARKAIFEEASWRLMDVANKLSARLEPADVAGAFLATVMKIAYASWGKERAAQYLRDAADGLDNLQPPAAH